MRHSDSPIDGPVARFPSTRDSLLALAAGATADARRAAVGAMTEAYWKPICAYIRWRWRALDDEAQDLTQAFLTDLLTDATLGRYDAARSGFRTYIRMCLDGFVANARQAAARLKRGGDQVFVSIEAHDVEAAAAADAAFAEDFFHREWQRQMFALGVGDLRAHAMASGRETSWRVFESRDLADEPESYATIARRFATSETAVTNHLAWARRELRRFVLNRVRSVTTTRGEFAKDARSLLGRGR